MLLGKRWHMPTFISSLVEVGMSLTQGEEFEE